MSGYIKNDHFVVLTLTIEDFQRLRQIAGDALVTKEIVHDGDEDLELVHDPLNVYQTGECSRCGSSFASNRKLVVCPYCKDFVGLT